MLKQIALGYQIFSDAADVPSQYQHLLTRLRIEQTRLLHWGDQIGLLKTPPEATGPTLGFSPNLINDVLLEIQAAFRGCMKIQHKYNPFLEQSDSISSHERSTAKRSKRELLLERALSVATKPSRAITRLHWAMVEQDSFKDLINKLITFNDKIESFLDRYTFEQIHALQVQSNMMLCQVTSDVSQLRLLVEAFDLGRKPATQVQIRTSRNVGSAPQFQLEGTAARLAQFKADATIIEQETLRQEPARIEIRDLRSLSSNTMASRFLGRYQQHHIWVEWREQVEDGRPTRQIQDIVTKRVKKLAALLGDKQKPAVFRSPHCLGYLCDTRDEVPRYALVYQVKISPQEYFSGLKTLREFLADYSMPSLGARIGLATALAESLFYLHAVSWLHKGIRSDNIIFIQSRSTQSTERPSEHDKTAEISSPILSGFDYSRPDLIDEQTFRNDLKVEHELYRHPDLLQLKTKRSSKAHDMYSLGLVLLEIALWKPVEEIVGIEARRSQLLAIGHSLATLDARGSDLRSKIAAQVGEGFAAAIEFCIIGGGGLSLQPKLDETNTDVAAHIQESFFENVVSKLQVLKI